MTLAPTFNRGKICNELKVGAEVTARSELSANRFKTKKTLLDQVDERKPNSSEKHTSEPPHFALHKSQRHKRNSVVQKDSIHARKVDFLFALSPLRANTVNV